MCEALHLLYLVCSHFQSFFRIACCNESNYDDFILTWFIISKAIMLSFFNSINNCHQHEYISLSSILTQQATGWSLFYCLLPFWQPRLHNWVIFASLILALVRFIWLACNCKLHPTKWDQTNVETILWVLLVMFNI